MGRLILIMLAVCILSTATATLCAARGDGKARGMHDMFFDDPVRTCSLCHFPQHAAVAREGYLPQWSRIYSLNQVKREQLQQQAKTIKLLRQELNHKEKSLAEAKALLALVKKVSALWIATEPKNDLLERKKLITLIKAACAAGAPLATACQIVGISEGTVSASAKQLR